LNDGNLPHVWTYISALVTAGVAAYLVWFIPLTARGAAPAQDVAVNGLTSYPNSVYAGAPWGGLT
jgi:hypothetical protein